MKGRNVFLAGAIPVIAGCSFHHGDEAGPKNVLFIMVDDLRPAIGCYGDTCAITPFIDSLASDATVYERAYCQQALSGPTRASLMTGLRPEEVGVTELNTWIRAKNPDVVTLPQLFKEAGYETVSVGKTFHGRRNTLDSLSWSQPPVLYGYTKTDEYMLQHNRTGEKAAAYEFTAVPEKQYPDVRIREAAAERLRMLSKGQKPFFLAVGFLKPHLPFCAPERFLKMYDSTGFGKTDISRIKGAPELAYHDSDELRGYTDIPSVGPMSREQLSALKKAYYACVSFADENVGMLVRELKKTGLYDDTVIVLLGDHGYHTGEQGLWCKSTNYEAACRAPLIIKHAGQKVGKKVGVPVEFVDIYPTLCGICGLEMPVGLAGDDLLEPDPASDCYAFSQFPRPYGALHKARLREYMGYTVRDTAWRYIEWIDNDGKVAATELYDMSSGGIESENVSGVAAYRNIEENLSQILRKSRAEVK